eukprot:Nk52_evm13s745 gene=Nk52_evmTU13s745
MDSPHRDGGEFASSEEADFQAAMDPERQKHLVWTPIGQMWSVMQSYGWYMVICAIAFVVFKDKIMEMLRGNNSGGYRTVDREDLRLIRERQQEKLNKDAAAYEERKKNEPVASPPVETKKGKEKLGKLNAGFAPLSGFGGGSSGRYRPNVSSRYSHIKRGG